jgi:hypothetical protein
MDFDAWVLNVTTLHICPTSCRAAATESLFHEAGTGMNGNNRSRAKSRETKQTLCCGVGRGEVCAACDWGESGKQAKDKE